MASFDDIPLLSALKGQMGYLNARQKVISENVANADTPGFTPKDLKPFDQVLADRTGAAAQMLTRTNAMHMEPPGQKAGEPAPIASPDSETRMDGNSVVLEEEMMRMSEAKSDYDTAVTLYQTTMSMLQTAAAKPS